MTTIGDRPCRWKQRSDLEPTNGAWFTARPREWGEKRFKFLVRPIVTKTDDKSLPYVGLENIESGTGRMIGMDIPAAAPAEANFFGPTDVLFGKLRPYLAKALAPDFMGRCTSEALVLRPNALDRKFLLYHCISHGFVSIVDSSTYGAKMPRAEWPFIGHLKTLLPPLAEQSAIADYLDRETARIDAMIAEKRRLVELIEERRAAVCSALVIRGVGTPSSRPTRIPWLDSLPSHWQEMRLAYLFRERDERFSPNLPLLNVSIHTGVTVRELSSAHVEQKASDFNVYKVARKGDIAFNKMRFWQGACGVAPVDGLVSPDYTVAQPIAAMETAYYGALFRDPRFGVEVSRHSHGIVWDRLRLYWDGFRDIRVPVPPLAEQREIAAKLRAATAGMDSLIAATETSINQWIEYRASLIAAAVTGQIDVRKQGKTRRRS